MELWRGVGLVIAFWWVATGIIIAMQATPWTRGAGLVLATLLAVVGFLEMRATREDDSPTSVRRSFLGGAMLWGWVSATFYGGFLTGIAPTAPTPPAPSWGAVLPAIAATIVSDAAALFLLIFSAWLDRGARNRTGLKALALFWSVQQVAKLNVFFGVENPAANFLPPHLAGLRQFFGPAVNSPFRTASLVMLVVATAWVLLGIRPRHTAGRRQAAAIYATILALAVLEIALLGVRVDSTPWDAFLTARDR